MADDLSVQKAAADERDDDYRGKARGEIRIGRLTIWLWAGSWSWVERQPCGHCRNVYVGPFGIEWERQNVR